MARIDVSTKLHLRSDTPFFDAWRQARSSGTSGDLSITIRRAEYIDTTNTLYREI